MKDEQTTNIIDADIGGKIGEAKIIVNHQHHEPRNRTWQVSDLIGLMNWVYKVVILQSGHSLSSHDKRGIVYQITLKSLKMLYKNKDVDITVYQHGKCFIFVKYSPSARGIR